MPRIKKTIDEYVLKQSLIEAESEGGFDNLNKLWTAVSEIYNLKILEESNRITPSIAMLRVKELKLEFKTKPGKRGRAKGSVINVANNADRKTKAEKFELSASHKEWLDTIKENAPTERFKTMADQCREKGSRTIALKLKCLECSCWSTKEVRDCKVKGCALWGFRPYQGPIEEDELEQINIDNVEVEEEELETANS
jgi:hypothetical protein